MKLTKSRRTYFKIAKTLAEMSDFPKVKIGCVIVYGHHLISSGFNTLKTAPIQKQFNIYRFSEDEPATHSLHAEIVALKPLIGRKDIEFKNIELYIYRQYKNGEPAPARPCESCMALIRKLNIRHLYYTNNGGYSHEEILG